MLKNPNYRENFGTDLGAGMWPDVLPSSIDSPEADSSSKCTAIEYFEDNLIKGVPAAPGVAAGPAAVI